MPVISASRRTDIPALYGGWLMDKVRRGYCLVSNPFSGKVERVSLALEDVEGIVFWSRNYRPMLDNLKTLHGSGYRFYCQFTIIGYPRFIDPGSPAPGSAAKTAHALSENFGPDAVVWRYDPVVLTSATDARWHIENFSALAALLEGAADTCAISFIDRYRKVERNFFPLLEKHGVEYLAPGWEQLEDLAGKMARIAAGRGITVQSCCEPKLAAVPRTCCVDAGRLARVTGRDMSFLKRAPTREGCGCRASKDIGAYDTCALGCAYCYANNSRERSAARRAAIAAEDLSLSAGVES